MLNTSFVIFINVDIHFKLHRGDRPVVSNSRTFWTSLTCSTSTAFLENIKRSNFRNIFTLYNISILGRKNTGSKNVIIRQEVIFLKETDVAV